MPSLSGMLSTPTKLKSLLTSNDSEVNILGYGLAANQPLVKFGRGVLYPDGIPVDSID